MTSKEMRLERKNNLSWRIAQEVRSCELNGTNCFLLRDGVVCRLSSMGEPYNALVLEYADNMELAQKGIFGEDGDLFYMDEMTEDEMFEAMLKEINE